MPRKYTAKQRQAKRDQQKLYWSRVRRIAQVEKISVTKARDFYSRGLFRGVREDVSKRVADRFDARRDSKGRLYVVKTSPSGKQTRVTPDRVDRAMASSTYSALVRRLVVHTGWKSGEVRSYLAQYPNYRDGISPLFRTIEPADDEDIDDDDSY